VKGSKQVFRASSLRNSLIWLCTV